MAKTKLVYDDARVEQLSFKDGFSTGFEACKDGIVNWRGRMGLQLYWFVILLIFCIPLVGQVIALLRVQNAYAGGMRYEQLLLAGRAPGYKDAWAVFAADLGLTKFSVMTFGMMFGAQMLAGVLGALPLGGFFALVGVLVVSPVLTGAVTLAAWSVAIQGSDGKVAMDKFPQIVKKGWSALAGQLVFMWLVMLAAVVLMTIVGVIMAFFMGVSGGLFLGEEGVGAGAGIAAAVLMFLTIVLVGSVAVIPLFGLGFHLLGRKMMMKSVEVVEVVEVVQNNPIAVHIPLPDEDHS